MRRHNKAVAEERWIEDSKRLLLCEIRWFTLPAGHHNNKVNVSVVGLNIAINRQECEDAM